MGHPVHNNLKVQFLEKIEISLWRIILTTYLNWEDTISARQRFNRVKSYTAERYLKDQSQETFLLREYLNNTESQSPKLVSERASQFQT